MMNRRDFILAAGAFSVAPSAVKASQAVNSGLKTDRSFAVLVSDCHIGEKRDSHENSQFQKTVRQILSFNPLPAKLIVMGDVAAMNGLKGDYINAKELFSPIVEAGIEIAWAMGNHDRRDVFGEVFPEYAATSEVKDRLVHVVKMPSVDLVLMDSLDQGRHWNQQNGRIDEAQIKWLEKFAASTTRPYFVCAHHDGRQMKSFAQQALRHSRLMRGYIHGHRHSWMLDALHDWKNGGRLARSIGLPSAGAWGDIGFVTMRDKGTNAEFKLYQRDCFFPKPDVHREEEWDFIRKENDGKVVTIVYK